LEHPPSQGKGLNPLYFRKDIGKVDFPLSGFPGHP
jgi:hypothetical protein